MAAIAIGLVWVSYTAGLWGYCLLRGYNVTPRQLLSSQWPPSPSTVNSPPSNTPGTPNIAPGFGIDPTKPNGGGYRPPGSK